MTDFGMKELNRSYTIKPTNKPIHTFFRFFTFLMLLACMVTILMPSHFLCIEFTGFNLFEK